MNKGQRGNVIGNRYAHVLSFSPRKKSSNATSIIKIPAVEILNSTIIILYRQINENN